MNYNKEEARYILENFENFVLKFEGQTGKPVTSGAREVIWNILKEIAND